LTRRPTAALTVLSKARVKANHIHQNNLIAHAMNQDAIEPNEEAGALSAELFDRLALRSNGESFDYSDEAQAAEAEETELQLVALGSVRLKIVDQDASALAIAAGVIEPRSPALVMRVAFEQPANAPTPCMGQHVVLPTEEPCVSLVFLVALTYADLHAGPDLGPGAERNTDLDALEPGQGLLVQVPEVPEGC
jgi:hypothetical protein